jgi:hypothetical protein
MSAPLISYNYGVLRVVPHVHAAAFANIGVVLHARTAEFLGMRVLTDPEMLRALVPDVDVELLCRYVDTCQAICRGDAAAGPLALISPSERFHWLTAPRSDVLQSSPVHEGLTDDPERALEELFALCVRH